MVPAFTFLVKILFYPAVRPAMPYDVTYKKMTAFFLMLHNEQVRALLHRTVVVSGLVFVMGRVGVFCEVQTELSICHTQ